MIPCLRLDFVVLDSPTLELPGAELEARAAQDNRDKATCEGKGERSWRRGDTLVAGLWMFTGSTMKPVY